MRAKYTARQVADTLIGMAREKRIEITNLKLQKLMYYAQAWHLVFEGRPLFDEEFEAWIHGPVIPSLFRDFRVWRWNPIGGEVNPVERDSRLHTHLEKILKVYGERTANQLERLSHSEDPWKDARGNLESDVSSRQIITKQSMKSFYSDLLNAQKNT